MRTARDSELAIAARETAPIVIETPATLEMVFLVEDMAETATWIEGVRRTGPRTAAFTDTNLLALYRRFVAVLYLARSVVDP
ncbi:MAG: M55 family metallopeptidase [Chloroflexia bacterium]